MNRKIESFHTHQFHLQHPLLKKMHSAWSQWTYQCKKASLLRTFSWQDPKDCKRLTIKIMQTKIDNTMVWKSCSQLTSGRREGPSKLLSMYLIRSKLSPLISLLCSNEGTCKTSNFIGFSFPYNHVIGQKSVAGYFDHLMPSIFCCNFIKMSNFISFSPV